MRNRRTKELVERPDVNVTDKIKLISRFIAQDIVENLEKGEKLTVGEVHYERVDAKSQWIKTSAGKTEYFDSIADLWKKEKIEALIEKAATQVTLNGVKYFQRRNVGGKTRWFKIADDEPERPQGVICSVQDIDSNAQQHFLQALLIQMDHTLHKHFEEYLEKVNLSIPETQHII